MENKLSLFDRKFLAACKISTAIEPFTDATFLHACGIDTTLTPEEFLDANKHRDISNCRGCGVRTFEQHSAECQHRALDGSRADFEAQRMALANRIAQHSAPDELDGTCRLLLAAGIPVTAENWMNLQFAGRPPAVGEVDGEILAELPDFVRKVYDPDYEPDDDEK